LISSSSSGKDFGVTVVFKLNATLQLLQEGQEPCWAVFENDYSLDDV